MNRYTIRLGYYTAWGIIILTILVAIGLLLLILTAHDSWNVWMPAKTCYYTFDTSIVTLPDICGFVYFIQTPLIIILFACFHDYALHSLKIFSRVSLSLIILFAAMNTLSYVAQFTIKGFNIHPCNHDCLHHAQSLFQYFATSVYIISITFFFGLAELFIIPVFSKTNHIERIIRLTLFIAGTVNLISAIMFIIDESGIFEFCMLLSQISFLAVVILFIKFFRQFKTHEV